METVVLLMLIGVAQSVYIYHSLSGSESLDIVLRSADVVGVKHTTARPKASDTIIYLNRPHAIFLCGTAELRQQLAHRINDVLVDDKENPAILIGKMSNIDKFLGVGDTGLSTEVKKPEDMLSEAHIGIGMTTDNRVYNYALGTKPCIVTAKPAHLNLLYRFANYIPHVNSPVTWPESSKWHGNCHLCKDLEGKRKLGEKDKVVIAGFILQWTPLLRNWLNNLLTQDIPRSTPRFYLIYCNVTEHQALVKEVAQASAYDGLVMDSSFFKDKKMSDVMLHSTAMCTSVDCTYLFTVTSQVAILRTNVISHLVQYNRSVIAPLVQSKPDNVPNFWGDVTPEGWYARSPDYWDIIDGAKGLFVVPYIKSIYLTKAEHLPDYQLYEKYGEGDIDLAMAHNYRASATLMWLDTTLLCGMYANMTRQEYPLPDPDLYTLEGNYHGFVDFALNKQIAFNLEDYWELAGSCSDSIVLPLFKDGYCLAFTTALHKYTWSTSSKVQLIDLEEFQYTEVVRSLVFKSVVPYVRQHFSLDHDWIDITLGKVVLFVQDPGSNEISPSANTYRTSYHVLYFLSDNESQGVTFPDESGCKTHLPSGSVLVTKSKAGVLSLIDTEERNIGVYTTLYI